MDILLKAISDSDTVLSTSGVVNFPQDDGVIQIEAEIITYKTIYMGTLYGCTRGARSTTPASHPTGSSISLVDFFDAGASPDTGITQLTGDVMAGPGSGTQTTTLADTLVTPGSYTLTNLTVDSKGRITAAANGSASPSFPLFAPNGTSIAPSYSFSSFHGEGLWFDSGRSVLATPSVISVDSGVITSVDGNNLGINLQNSAIIQVAHVLNGSFATGLNMLNHTIFGSPTILAANGSDAAPSYSFTTAPSGMWLASTTYLGFSVNGTNIAGFSTDDIGTGSGGLTFDSPFDIALNGGQFIGSAGTAINPSFLCIANPGTGPGIFGATSTDLGIAANGVEVARFDSSVVATETRFMLWDVDSGALQRVTVGTADSGGTGFKVLRIPN